MSLSFLFLLFGLNNSVEKALKVNRNDCREFAMKFTWEDCANEFLDSQIDSKN